MFTYRPLLRCLITAMLVFPLTSSGSDDRDRSVAIKADEVDMDLKSGQRTYRGHVEVTLGKPDEEGFIMICTPSSMSRSRGKSKLPMEDKPIEPGSAKER